MIKQVESPHREPVPGGDAMWHSSHSIASCRCTVLDMVARRCAKRARLENEQVARGQGAQDGETERDEHSERKGGWNSRSEATRAARDEQLGGHETFQLEGLVLRDQEHKFVAQRLTQDASQMMTASCDAGKQDQRLQDVLNEGSLVRARRKTAQDEAHGAGAQRGTVAAWSEHWQRCEIEPGEGDGAVVRRGRCIASGERRQADVASTEMQHRLHMTPCRKRVAEVAPPLAAEAA